MSGIEIVSIAASVLQLADLGGRLSVKLFTFSRKIKNADKSIASISAEIAQTGSILQQLGNELNKDDKLRLCSAEAVATAKVLVDECYKIFDELNDSLDARLPKNKVVAAWKQKLNFPLIEPQVDLLRTNLERLKSSLLVMLNVLIFAEQLRNQEALPILKDQRELVQTLVDDKNALEAKLQRILRAVEDLKVHDVAPPHSVFNANAFIFNPVILPSPDRTRSPGDETPRQLPSLLGVREEEVRHQCRLLRNVIEEIGFSHYKVDHGLRDRMRRGVLGAHWDGWSSLRKLYGDDVLFRAFSEVPAITQFWASKLEAEAEAAAEAINRNSLKPYGMQKLGPKMNISLQPAEYRGTRIMRLTRDMDIEVDGVQTDLNAEARSSLLGMVGQCETASATVGPDKLNLATEIPGRSESSAKPSIVPSTASPANLNGGDAQKFDLFRRKGPAEGPIELRPAGYVPQLLINERQEKIKDAIGPGNKPESQPPSTPIGIVVRTPARIESALPNLGAQSYDLAKLNVLVPLQEVTRIPRRRPKAGDLRKWAGISSPAGGPLDTFPRMSRGPLPTTANPNGRPPKQSEPAEHFAELGEEQAIQEANPSSVAIQQHRRQQKPLFEYDDIDLTKYSSGIWFGGGRESLPPNSFYRNSSLATKTQDSYASPNCAMANKTFPFSTFSSMNIGVGSEREDIDLSSRQFLNQTHSVGTVTRAGERPGSGVHTGLQITAAGLGLQMAAAGLRSPASAGIYEGNKAQHEAEAEAATERRTTRARSRKRRSSQSPSVSDENVTDFSSLTWLSTATGASNADGPLRRSNGGAKAAAGRRRSRSRSRSRVLLPQRASGSFASPHQGFESFSNSLQGSAQDPVAYTDEVDKLLATWTNLGGDEFLQIKIRIEESVEAEEDSMKMSEG